MRRQRTGSREYLQRRCPPPGIPRPVRLGRRTEHRRERRLRLAQRDPAFPKRTGLHDLTPVRLGVPVIKASKGLAPSSHFPVGFRLPVDSARQGAARHAWRTSGRPGSLLTLAPHRSGRAGSAASGSSTDSFATRRRVPAGPGSQAMATAIPKASCALGFSWTLDCERVLAGGVSR